MPAYATPTSGRAWWTAMVNKTGASTPQIIPQAPTTAATQASPWYANLGVFAPQEGINVQSVLAPEGGINVQSLGAPQAQAPGYNETQWTGPQPQVDASFQLPKPQEFSTADDFAPTMTVASQAPVATAPTTGSNDDDYMAAAIIAFARPDIFGVIGKDTTWDKTRGGTINPNDMTDAELNGELPNTVGTDQYGKRNPWENWKPLRTLQTVEEWVHMGQKPGANDPATSPYAGEFQDVAAQLKASLTPEQLAKAARLADTWRAMDHVTTFLTGGGWEYNRFQQWREGKENENGGTADATLWVNRIAALMWTGEGGAQQHWGVQTKNIQDIAKALEWKNGQTPGQILNLVNNNDYAPNSSQQWLAYDPKRPDGQFNTANTRPYMRGANKTTVKFNWTDNLKNLYNGWRLPGNTRGRYVGKNPWDMDATVGY